MMEGKFYVKPDITPEQFLANLTDAVYQVTLRAGINVSFIKLQLDLHDALREVISVDMLVSDDLIA